MRAIISAVVLSFGICCGCNLHRVTVQPGVSGFVIDGQTRKGIGGAQVSLARDGTSGELAAQKTKLDGSFCILPKHKRHIHWVGLPIEDYFFLTYTLTVQDPGYNPASLEFRCNPILDPVSTNLAEIRLEPFPK